METEQLKESQDRFIGLFSGLPEESDVCTPHQRVESQQHFSQDYDYGKLLPELQGAVNIPVLRSYLAIAFGNVPNSEVDRNCTKLLDLVYGEGQWKPLSPLAPIAHALTLLERGRILALTQQTRIPPGRYNELLEFLTSARDAVHIYCEEMDKEEQIKAAEAKKASTVDSKASPKATSTISLSKKGALGLKTKLTQHLKQRPTKEELEKMQIMQPQSEEPVKRSKSMILNMIPEISPLPKLNWSDINKLQELPLLITRDHFRDDKVIEDYTIESGATYSESMYEDAVKTIVIEGREKDEAYFKQNIASKDHENYLWEDPTYGPMIASVQSETIRGQRVLVRTSRADIRLRMVSSKPSKPREILKNLPMFSNEFTAAKWTKVNNPDLDKALITMEEQSIIKQYKFGVLYCAEGQMKENDMFGNVRGSPEFDEFLSMIGERIELNGWQKFRGGLDIKKNSTGTHTIYSTLKGFEILFHVSTLLPFNPNDPQQLERKRHLGNDVVVVIFKEGDQKFAGSMLRSEFNHQFVVVQRVESNDGSPCYRVEVCCKDSVPSPSRPLLQSPPHIRSENFREWFLTKLINLERSAMEAPHFRYKLERTRKMLLSNYIQEYGKNAR